MASDFQVEFVSEDEYVVRAKDGADTVESWFHLDVDLLRQLGVENADPAKVVEQTAVFLAERQPVADFPGILYLEDLVAVYDDYPERLRGLLS
jgi:hypothetical protein